MNRMIRDESDKHVTELLLVAIVGCLSNDQLTHIRKVLGIAASSIPQTAENILTTDTTIDSMVMMAEYADAVRQKLQAKINDIDDLLK